MFSPFLTFTGVSSVPNEMEYQDLKKLKNTPIVFPELDQINIPIIDDLTQKPVKLFQPNDETPAPETQFLGIQPVSEGVAPQTFLSVNNDDILEVDCAPTTPNLLGEVGTKIDPFPALPIFEESTPLSGLEKVLAVPELPPLEKERNWLENIKKTECQTPETFGFQSFLQPTDEVENKNTIQPTDTSSCQLSLQPSDVTGSQDPVQPSCSFGLYQPAEDSFLSVQTKKAFNRKARTSAVSCVPKEDLAQNFVQHELRRVEHFIPG